MPDLKEKGLEALIEQHLLSVNGYESLVSNQYSKEYALCPEIVEEYITCTQAKKVKNTMCFSTESERKKFFSRLRDEITKRGVTDVLRKGFRYISESFDMYCVLPNEKNPEAVEEYKLNRFAVMRQLFYSEKNQNSVDMVIFINGLPVITMELKNSLTNQTVNNAVRQYQIDRDPKELLFMPKRCAVHFAVDDCEIKMCTELKGKSSWFLPFNKGVDGGAGNPVNPNGLMTSYLWEDILEKRSLSNIIENFAQVIIESKRDRKTKRIIRKEKNIWPRYHQLMCVRELLSSTLEKGIGNKYLIQHSAGSGKSNSITWLAYQLVDLMKDKANLFDSILVVTDRVNLDKQIRDNITAFKKLSNLVAWASDSTKLRKSLNEGKKIIITIVHKFPFILDTIDTKMKDKRFAIIIDEAHSSQNGEMSNKLNMALSGNGIKEDDDTEERINKTIEGRKMLKNANYYAFTATPKNKTLEKFGIPFQSVNADGDPETKFRPFHEYTMKQAIEEGFIMDVLKNYTVYASFYKIMKASEDDPEYDKKQASRKLRAYVEARPETIEQKSRIIVEHFCTKTAHKLGGQARAMVVTSSIKRAIEFYDAISQKLKERKSPYKAIVAFSGSQEYHGKADTTESDINGFPSADIEDMMEEDPYRILIVADKYQTGYDQPLLHTMYVDKVLTDVKAVQTLSRLNRCHPLKQDTFVLDFANKYEDIMEAFQKFYKVTILSRETDRNKLNDLISDIEETNIYTQGDVDTVCEIALGNSENRGGIDVILDNCVETFKELDEKTQIKCKSAIKNYNRTYPFLASIMPYKSVEWEKLYQFYSLLVHKLPVLKGEDFAKDIIEKIDFDKYRLVKKEDEKMELQNTDTEIDPIPIGSGAAIHTPDFDLLSNIVEEFNLNYGGIDWKFYDKANEQFQKLPDLLIEQESFKNAVKNSDEETVKTEATQLLLQIILNMLNENTEFATNYLDNLDFQKFVNERVVQRAHNRMKAQEGQIGFKPDTNLQYKQAAENKVKFRK